MVGWVGSWLALLAFHVTIPFTDVSFGFEDSMTLSQVPAVCEAVETWLGNMVSGQAASSS